jgi:predicted aspartyl protease
LKRGGRIPSNCPDDRIPPRTNLRSRRRVERRSGRLERLAAATAVALVTSFCAAPELRVEVQPAQAVTTPMRPGPFNAEELLSHGEYLEVERHFSEMPRAELEANPQALAYYGRALLARGDLDDAAASLSRAIAAEARPARRAEMEWALAQGFIFWDEPSLALEYASAARRDGFGLLPGFLRFLEAIENVDLYAGPAFGEKHEAEFSMSGFDLIRLPVKINGSDSAAILDTGAAYTILTQSFARQVGVREIPDSKAFGRGLHTREFPLTFGIADRLEVCGFAVRNVPVMLMPDDALLFETSRGEFPVPMVLGLHLIKQFTVELDYRRRAIEMTRADFRGPKHDPDQNLFAARGRIFVRASVNRSGWYAMLLDTGSEPTMMTSGGVRRAGLPASNKFYPRKLYGLGKSEAAWSQVDAVTIGMSGFAVRFRNLVVKEDDGALEDGVLGNSYLKNFHVRIDFRRMLLTLTANAPAGIL